MTKTTYKVGDKVRILNAGAIMACEAKDGDILEVIDVEASVIPTLRDVDGEGLCMLGSELKYIEKVAEQVAKFKVGDKVRIIKDMGGIAGVKIGTVATVIEVDSDGDVRVDVINKHGKPAFFIAHEVEIISQKPTKNQRIPALEKTVADLQAEVEALKAAQKLPTMTVKADVDVAKIAESIAKAIEKHSPKSPNEQRKAIIGEAKAFVAEKLAEVDEQMGWQTTNIPVYKEYGRLRIEFNVNADKRTVVALARFGNILTDTTVHGKGIAKCAPDDIFNADIGKAIALGRALGLDVSKFEKAVQPSQVVVGQVVKGREEIGRSDFEASVTGMFPSANDRGYGTAFRHSGGFGWLGEKQVHIINDTEAQY